MSEMSRMPSFVRRTISRLSPGLVLDRGLQQLILQGGVLGFDPLDHLHGGSLGGPVPFEGGGELLAVDGDDGRDGLDLVSVANRQGPVRFGQDVIVDAAPSGAFARGAGGLSDWPGWKRVWTGGLP